MTQQASFTLRGRNPDVLSCIANLSNDEVFTPPEFANRMLDTLAEGWAAGNKGADIWADSKVTFLDPCTKSGVFLREITKRLIKGLEEEIPDLQTRVDHILTKQVFGIGITRLTSLLARRSLYCSKHATGVHSVATAFADDDGNVWFERIEHSWRGGRCKFCGASEDTLSRGEAQESHAYAFIHTDDISARLGELFGGKMHFDVIIGNPPYQLNDGGAGTSAIPIYQKFVEQAKALQPRFLSMVTPARWVAGGKGLDEFRERMLNDRNIRTLVDYLNASDAFPGVDVAGGITYFLWDRDNAGDCEVTTIHKGEAVGPVARRLDEFDVFVRHAPSVQILHKIWPEGPLYEASMASLVSSRKAFGFATNDRGKPSKVGMDDPVELVSSVTNDRYQEWVERSSVQTNVDWIDQWKTTVGGAAPAGGRPDKEGRYYGLSSIRILPPGKVCTESYPVAGHFDSESEARALASYLKTRFARFLISLRAVTQHVTRGSFAFVPIVELAHDWTDEMLFEKFELTAEEAAFIESMVRPMDAAVA
jgi:site-specific DNA-methyltransferase (adenine-specific)